MSRRHIPQDVLDSAHARSAARAARDWPEADRLRAEIEAAGWTVVDRGTDFALSPSAPPDVVDGGLARYGSSAAVPSLLEDAPTAPVTVVLVATIRALKLHGGGDMAAEEQDGDGYDDPGDLCYRAICCHPNLR